MSYLLFLFAVCVFVFEYEMIFGNPPNVIIRIKGFNALCNQGSKHQIFRIAGEKKVLNEKYYTEPTSISEKNPKKRKDEKKIYKSLTEFNVKSIVTAKSNASP